MNFFKYLIISFLVASVFPGCNKFLNINAPGHTDEDNMFEDLQGFKDAMYGVYATLAQPPLYGETMSYGFIDDLAQLYYLYPSTEMEKLKLIHRYAYTDQRIASYAEDIWRYYYKSISYVNNVLRHIERIADKPDYALIKGEAHGLRAFLHFEVLRLYADNIQTAPDARGIPYSFTFDLENKTVYSLNDSYANILKDLDEAEKLLQDDNTLFLQVAPDDYKTVRYIHFNKYAVFALKARVFLWMQEYKKSLEYAQKVIEFNELKLATKHEIAEAKKFPGKRELIWGLSSDKLYPNVFARFLKYIKGDSNDRRLMRRDVNQIYEQQLFSANSSDARYTNFILPADGEFIFIRLLEKEVDATIEANAIQGICMLRLPEMYYIAAESLFESDPAKALTYYNAVRTSRGLREVVLSEVTSKAVFENLLLKERIKEFWGEGQIFFDYKRLNTKFTTIENHTIQPSKEIFVLPWPKNERDYGDS